MGTCHCCGDNTFPHFTGIAVKVGIKSGVQVFHTWCHVCKWDDKPLSTRSLHVLIVHDSMMHALCF